MINARTVFATELPSCYDGKVVGISHCRCESCPSKTCGFRNYCNVADVRIVGIDTDYFFQKDNKRFD